MSNLEVDLTSTRYDVVNLSDANLPRCSWFLVHSSAVAQISCHDGHHEHRRQGHHHKHHHSHHGVSCCCDSRSSFARQRGTLLLRTR